VIFSLLFSFAALVIFFCLSLSPFPFFLVHSYAARPLSFLLNVGLLKGYYVNATYPGEPIPWDQPASILSVTSTPFPPDPPPPTSSGRRQFTAIAAVNPLARFFGQFGRKIRRLGK
jgi:hypothetical protein